MVRSFDIQPLITIFDPVHRRMVPVVRIFLWRSPHSRVQMVE